MRNVIYNKVFVFLIMLIAFSLLHDICNAQGAAYNHYLTDGLVSATGDYRNDGYAILDGDFITDNTGKTRWEYVQCQSPVGYSQQRLWLKIHRSTGTISRNVAKNEFIEMCDLKEGVNYHITVVYYFGDGLVLPNFDLYINGYKLGNFIDDYLELGAGFNRFDSDLFNKFTYVRDSSNSFSINEYLATLSKLDNNDNSISLSVAENGYDDHKLTIFTEMTLPDLQAKITGAYSETKHLRNNIEVSDIIQTGDIIRVTSANGMVVNDYAVEVAELQVETDKISFGVSDGRVSAIAYSKTGSLSLYIASYKDDELIELESAIPVLSDDLYRYETSSVAIGDGIGIKAFLWDGNLVPIDNKKMP